MADTKIEWSDAVWNPTRGCSLVSEGCRLCYAMKQAHRFSGAGAAYDGLTKLTMNGPHWTGQVRTVPELLDQPLRWRKPRKIFVNSMSDLFHEDVPDGFIDQVFGTMDRTPQHTYQILTKRPERMLSYCSQYWKVALDNVWLGVSVEDQKTADARIPLLLQTPAAIRFVSYEPALAEVNFAAIPAPGCYLDGFPDGLHWVIVGGESGPGARPFNVQWARHVRRACYVAGVPCFIKQMGSLPIVPACRQNHFEWGDGNFKEYDADHWRITLKDRKGGDWDEWADDLRVREFPECGQQ